MTGPGHDDQPQPDQAAEHSSDELVDLLRRERADFRNYQRRVATERAADTERIRGQLLEPLFPVLDDLRRAFAEIPAGLRDDPWTRGIAMLVSRLDATLVALGLTPVGAVGEPFDPARHDAVHHEPDPQATEQTVALVVRPGYQLGERLLRPAQVVVRGPRDGSTAEPPSPSDDVSPRPVAHGHPDDVSQGG